MEFQSLRGFEEVEEIRELMNLSLGNKNNSLESEILLSSR